MEAIRTWEQWKEYNIFYDGDKIVSREAPGGRSS
jgi:hypothetical protein